MLDAYCRILQVLPKNTDMSPGCDILQKKIQITAVKMQV